MQTRAALIGLLENGLPVSPQCLRAQTTASPVSAIPDTAIPAAKVPVAVERVPGLDYAEHPPPAGAPILTMSTMRRPDA